MKLFFSQIQMKTLFEALDCASSTPKTRQLQACGAEKNFTKYHKNTGIQQSQ